MASPGATRTAIGGVLLAGLLAVSPAPTFAVASDVSLSGRATAAASCSPANLQFRPHPVPEAYVGRPFEVTVAIVDAFMNVVTEGTSATVTLAIETSPAPWLDTLLRGASRDRLGRLEQAPGP